MPDGNRTLYSAVVANDVWIGAVTTLVGAAAGGTISFALSRLQMKDARLQREEQARREDDRRNADRRFEAYSEFLTRVRIFRTTVESYYVLPNHRPSIEEIDTLMYSANEASSQVFLVVGSEETFESCRDLMRAIDRAHAVIHGIETSRTDDPATEFSRELGAASRAFQNAVRKELGVSGPAVPWSTHEEPVAE